MAFTTMRGRPRTRNPNAAPHTDLGTPELRLKHALGATAEPIDLCLSRALVTREQHWCALHLRWLYTLRYGAPVLTTRYTDRVDGSGIEEDNQLWRQMREQEYNEAVVALKKRQRYEAVMRVCVFNEVPSFLNQRLQARAWHNAALAEQLLRAQHKLQEGLDILTLQWKRPARSMPVPQ